MNLEKIAACIMVDTIGLRVPDVDVSRLPKKFKQMGGGDDSRWATGALQTEDGKNSLDVRGVKSKGECLINGSPSLHRQGHNIVSSNNVPMLAYHAIRDTNKKFDLGISARRATEFATGKGMFITRLDTPIYCKFPDGLEMKTVINGMAMAGIASGYNTSVYLGQTVYFDQHSQLSTLKGYDKAAQIARFRKWTAPVSDNFDLLMALIKRAIRLEPVYRAKYLQRRFGDQGPLTPSMLTPEVMAEMFAEQLSKYDLRRDIRRCLTADELMAIPREYRAAVMSWQHGYDPKKTLEMSGTSYARCAAYLYGAHKINLAGPPPGELNNRVELGELLTSENFVPIQDEILADKELFFTRDMDAIRSRLLEQAVSEESDLPSSPVKESRLRGAGQSTTGISL